nr:PH-interacting protein [Tanacetum cinerariifolium]
MVAGQRKLEGQRTADERKAANLDHLDDEEDIRSSHEYLNDLEEEYQARALLAKSKRFFKKGGQDRGSWNMVIVYCIMRESTYSGGRDAAPGIVADSLLYHEGMSILSGRKSVPGMNSRKKGKWKEKTTRSSRELNDESSKNFSSINGNGEFVERTENFGSPMKYMNHVRLFEGSIKWGGSKSCSIKRPRITEPILSVAKSLDESCTNGSYNNVVNEKPPIEKEEFNPSDDEIQKGKMVQLNEKQEKYQDKEPPIPLQKKLRTLTKLKCSDIQGSHEPDSRDKMFKKVYRRSKSTRSRTSVGMNGGGMEASTSNANSINLEYETHPGSGEGCCKMTLQFEDPSSNVVGKTFKLTHREVTGFPDFLVE